MADEIQPEEMKSDEILEEQHQTTIWFTLHVEERGGLDSPTGD